LARQIVLKLKSASGGVLWSWDTLKRVCGIIARDRALAGLNRLN
jgi:hypothetical protein